MRPSLQMLTWLLIGVFLGVVTEWGWSQVTGVSPAYRWAGLQGIVIIALVRIQLQWIEFDRLRRYVRRTRGHTLINVTPSPSASTDLETVTQPVGRIQHEDPT